MRCPRCESTQLSKNGPKGGKQRYLCKDCGRQLVEFYASKGYSDKVKRHCLTLSLYVNGIGFRAIEPSTGVNHNSVITWVKQVGQQLPDAPEDNQIPAIAQVDQLQSFVGSRKTRSGCR